ncbi:23S rRNA (adenine(1618)-N(6))-methyltransferase RlmF [Alteromonas sp. A081]|uniref:23S rRNA (adenine(1618)-N(6))-methyltransferase RlmF n=1 Tax=Alteromonas sp. A081 TaxID=3410269 RepID=UPI003B984FC6
MHPRSYHNDGYPMSALCTSFPSLKPHIINARSGQKSIDFANSESVLALNTAILAHYYNVSQWQLPKDYLCPPVPGRADYIHGIADLLVDFQKMPEPLKRDAGDHQTIVSSSKSVNTIKARLGNHVRGLDVGVGANAIYPIIGSQVYDWSFVGSDIDETAYNNASVIVKNNSSLYSRIEIRRQLDPEAIFAGIIGDDDHFTFTMCNPPFHKSAQDALGGSARKNKNLAANRTKRSGKHIHAQTGNKTYAKTSLNFAGQANELWCEGGELAFIQRMIRESVEFKQNVTWFTCLVSKSEHIKPIERSVAYYKAKEIKVVNMEQGNKQSRFVAWRFA